MIAHVFTTGKYVLCLAVIVLLGLSCGGPVGGDSKSPVYLTVQGSSVYGLIVDVYDTSSSEHYADEFFDVTITSRYKDENGGNPLTRSNAADVILREYRVTYYRSDGNLDVPDPFMVPCMVTVPAGGVLNQRLLVVRREAKLDHPLTELVLGGGEGVLYANAVIEWFGEDLMGNQVSTKYVVYLTFQDNNY